MEKGDECKCSDLVTDWTCGSKDESGGVLRLLLFTEKGHSRREPCGRELCIWKRVMCMYVGEDSIEFEEYLKWWCVH